MNSSNYALGIRLDRLHRLHVDPWPFVLYRHEGLGNGDLNSSCLVLDDLDGPNQIPKDFFLDDLDDDDDDLGLAQRKLFLGRHHDCDLNPRYRVLDGVDLSPNGFGSFWFFRRVSGRKTCSKVWMLFVIMGRW